MEGEETREVTGREGVEERLERLEGKLTEVMEKEVPIIKIGRRTKLWWSNELKEWKRRCSRLGKTARRKRRQVDHPVHEE